MYLGTQLNDELGVRQEKVLLSQATVFPSASMLSFDMSEPREGSFVRATNRTANESGQSVYEPKYLLLSGRKFLYATLSGSSSQVRNLYLTELPSRRRSVTVPYSI